jgi:hypothetical protein
MSGYIWKICIESMLVEIKQRSEPLNHVLINL